MRYRRRTPLWSLSSSTYDFKAELDARSEQPLNLADFLWLFVPSEPHLQNVTTTRIGHPNRFSSILTNCTAASSAKISRKLAARSPLERETMPNWAVQQKFSSGHSRPMEVQAGLKPKQRARGAEKPPQRYGEEPLQLRDWGPELSRNLAINR